MLMGFIDFVMVSQLGTTAQAAISPCTILIFTVACLGMGIAHSTQTFVSQADGRREPHLAGGYAWQSLYVAMAATLLAWPIAVTTHPVVRLDRRPRTPLSRYDGPRDRVHAHRAMVGAAGRAHHGARRVLHGHPASARHALCRGGLASLVVNAVGNYAADFREVRCFPEMGMAGAAVATVVGWAVRSANPAAVHRCGLITSTERYNTRRSMAFSWQPANAPRTAASIGAPNLRCNGWSISARGWSSFR